MGFRLSHEKLGIIFLDFFFHGDDKKDGVNPSLVDLSMLDPSSP